MSWWVPLWVSSGTNHSGRMSGTLPMVRYTTRSQMQVSIAGWHIVHQCATHPGSFGAPVPDPRATPSKQPIRFVAERERVLTRDGDNLRMAKSRQRVGSLILHSRLTSWSTAIMICTKHAHSLQ